MLQVAVHGDDVFATSMVEAGRQSRSLAEIPPQPDDRHPAIHACNLAEQRKTIV